MVLRLPNSRGRERGPVAGQEGEPVALLPRALAVTSSYALEELRQPMPGSPLRTNPPLLHSAPPLGLPPNLGLIHRLK